LLLFKFCNLPSLNRPNTSHVIIFCFNQGKPNIITVLMVMRPWLDNENHHARSSESRIHSVIRHSPAGTVYTCSTSRSYCYRWTPLKDIMLCTGKKKDTLTRGGSPRTMTLSHRFEYGSWVKGRGLGRRSGIEESADRSNQSILKRISQYD
jgi:hypothetical protein